MIWPCWIRLVRSAEIRAEAELRRADERRKARQAQGR